MEKRVAKKVLIGIIAVIILFVIILILWWRLSPPCNHSTGLKQIDNAIQNDINSLFSEDNVGKLIIYPPTRSISLIKGDVPKGFAFSVRNNDVEKKDFSYSVKASNVLDCGEDFTKADAESLILDSSREFSLDSGDILDLPILIRFDIPESAPLCTIIYDVEITKNNEYYTKSDIYVYIKKKSSFFCISYF